MADSTPQARERFVSRKLWIKEILDGEFNTTEPTGLVTSRTQAGRVNIIGVVISKEDLPVATVIVDDGTGQITVRSFEQPIKQGIGAMIQVIGRPRAYQGQLYIAGELFSSIDPGWAEYRKHELGEVKEQTKKAEPEKVEEENNSEKLLRLIKQLDSGEGADIDEVITHSKLANAEDMISQMLMHGDIFELRPGRVKLL